MARVCTPIALNCDYCFTLTVPFGDIMYVSAGLTPAENVYLWVTDKFGNQYKNLVTIAVDGSFPIDTSNYPSFLFNPLGGWFDIFISSDTDGATIIPMTFVSEFNCLKLNTECVETDSKQFENNELFEFEDGSAYDFEN